MTSPAAPANRLVHEASPYLQQHAYNPVDWYPWGEEALKAAREQNKPILLSIGYSTCHWCHVMERDTFEDLQAAETMNRLFINIKVDREEHPDLDGVYMQASQILTGYGGWPLNVWLHPTDLAPFYAGGYMPAHAKGQMPGFIKLCELLAEQYHSNPAHVADIGQRVREALAEAGAASRAAPLPSTILTLTVNGARATYDALLGGFGRPPKFPPAMLLTLLLRYAHHQQDTTPLDMVTHTLRMMAHGGMYDQVGGGFHRYSTDAQWLVPHFEKMLYDNALLAQCYVEGWQLTGEPLFRQIAEATLGYVLRDLTHPEGGFYSAEDADSLPPDDPAAREKEEGLFYVWTPSQFDGALEGTGLPVAFLKEYWDITPRGSFEGHSIPHVLVPLNEFASRHGLDAEVFSQQVTAARQRLLEVRSTRPRPHLDDKVLTSWNGLMLSACCRAGMAFGAADYLQAARRAADFVLTHLRDSDGGLLRRWRNGDARLPGTLEDYAFFANGLLDLYEAWGNPDDLAIALDLAGRMRQQFTDPAGGFFLVPEGAPNLLLRPKEFFDNATPAGNSVAAWLCARLGVLTGDESWIGLARGAMQAPGQYVQLVPTAFGWLLQAYLFLEAAPQEIVLVGDRAAEATRALQTMLQRAYLPHKVLVQIEPGDARTASLTPLAMGKELIGGQPAVYLCQNFACQQPVTTPEELALQLG